jgi:hypothetical protein
LSSSNACTNAFGLYSIGSSSPRQELMANDTNKKLTITDKNLILILNDCVYLQVAKIGTFFPILNIVEKFYIKL